VENLVIDPQFWRGRRVYLTGHTGFKGAWAALMLSQLGAEVTGFALPAANDDDLFEVAKVAPLLHKHRLGDIRNLASLATSLHEAAPEIVIHFAAQSLVRLSYDEPVATYETNVMGTVHLLEAVRRTPGVRATIIVTSDKCYENVGWVWGYREADRLGGHDPYSNSKGCAELVTDSYRRSFFPPEGRSHIASVRAGNVIGGGDWARDRLVPDAMRAFRASEPLKIRNPHAIRPWQHVLDPVAGYLRLAQCLFANGADFAEGWNFGPGTGSEVRVSTLIAHLADLWGNSAHWQLDGDRHVHEAAYLKLDCSKAASRLDWQPAIDFAKALRLTVDWYRSFGNGQDMRETTMAQIGEFLAATTGSTGSRV
jgi:CDP-glucose 4,6-dehydratase